MAEKCPKCKTYTLNYNPYRKSAKCYSVECGFEKYVIDRDRYFDEFVITEFNWSNYCNATPAFVREIRGHTAPLKNR